VNAKRGCFQWAFHGEQKGVQSLWTLSGDCESHCKKGNEALKYIMMINMNCLLLIIGFLLAFGLSFSGATVTEEGKALAEEISIEVTKYPPFPHSLKEAGYSEGLVRYLISLDEEGKLEDALVVEATHVGFGLAVDPYIDKWKFEPPRVDGEPVPVVFPLNIYFRSGQTVRTVKPGLDQPMKIFRPERYRAYELHELDRVPRPIHKIPPSLPISMAGHFFQDLEISYSFYIDQLGNVRIPILESVNQKVDELLLVQLQETLKRWKFESPLVNNRPVLAKAVQPFHLDGQLMGIESYELYEDETGEPGQ